MTLTAAKNTSDRHLGIKFREEGFFFTSIKTGTNTNISFWRESFPSQHKENKFNNFLLNPVESTS